MSEIDRVVAELQREVGDRIVTNVDLRDHTTYRVGGPASALIEIEAMHDLEALSRVLAEGEGVEVLPLGRGSNLVVSDSGFEGLVVRLGPRFAALSGEGPALVAGGAAPMPQVANRAARRGLSGMEFGIAIPGSVGGGVKMNAGAHGAEVADHLATASIFDVSTGALEERAASTLGLSYRHSSLSDHELVVSARWELDEDDPAAIKARTEANRKHRAETQPGAVQNAGSVFKNPPGDHAGRLVEAAGLKGFAVGGARVSELHANFFIAGQGSTAQDVYGLVQAVRERVKEAAGIALETEIRFVGRFD
jgi:UDP-N-acetylmuramate dehydrogenase